MDVYATGISAKVSVHYPGRSALSNRQKSAEAIVFAEEIRRRRAERGMKAIKTATLARKRALPTKE